MQPLLIVLGVIVGVVVLVAMFIAGIYNGLVTLRNRFKNEYGYYTNLVCTNYTYL